MLTDFKNSFKADSSNHAHLNHVATLPCDVSLINIHNTCFRLFMFFSDVYISESSVAARLRCGEIFYYHFTGNLLLSLSAKAF